MTPWLFFCLHNIFGIGIGISIAIEISYALALAFISHPDSRHWGPCDYTSIR